MDERVDVGDRDEDLHRAVGERLGDGELVEVARIVVVDRGPQQLAQVADRRIAVGGRGGEVAQVGRAAGGKSGSSPRWIMTRRAMAWRRARLEEWVSLTWSPGWPWGCSFLRSDVKAPSCVNDPRKYPIRVEWSGPVGVKTEPRCLTSHLD